MPPRTPEEVANRRINNLIGFFAISVFFFFVTWLLGRSSGSPVSPWLMAFFALMGCASLLGWMWLSYTRVAHRLLR